MVVANLSRDAQNYLTDNYALVNDRNRIETLFRNSIIEYNKEKAKISFPLYPVSHILIDNKNSMEKFVSVLHGIIMSFVSYF